MEIRNSGRRNIYDINLPTFLIAVGKLEPDPTPNQHSVGCAYEMLYKERNVDPLLALLAILLGHLPAGRVV
jgi:hypothetical protein